MRGLSALAVWWKEHGKVGAWLGWETRVRAGRGGGREDPTENMILLHIHVNIGGLQCNARV